VKRTWLIVALTVACAAESGSSEAQNVIAYPSKGQSQQTQDQDRYACHSWAVQQSGYDPSRSAAQVPPPNGSGLMRGATRGAAVGAVGGAIGGNAGKGAGIGAATGALVGGMRRQYQYGQQQVSTAQQGDLYDRAFGTCMQGRGYTVG
jgi:hypothetical protein